MTDKEKFIQKNKKSGLIGVAIAVVMLIIAIITGEAIFTGIAIFLLIGGLMFIFGRKQANDKFCSQCGSSRNWDDADCIEWEVVSEINDGKKLEDTVEIRLTCPKCGFEDVRTKKIVVARVDNNGNIIKKNLDVEVRNLFK